MVDGLVYYLVIFGKLICYVIALPNGSLNILVEYKTTLNPKGVVHCPEIAEVHIEHKVRSMRC